MARIKVVATRNVRVTTSYELDTAGLSDMEVEFLEGADGCTMLDDDPTDDVIDIAEFHSCCTQTLRTDDCDEPEAEVEVSILDRDARKAEA